MTILRRLISPIFGPVPDAIQTQLFLGLAGQRTC
jgi:hypothetical protein